MKFVIERTSDHTNKRPHKKAKLEKVACWDIRTCTEEYFNENHNENGLWRDSGKNHRIIKNGDIARRMKDKDAWTININTLKELKSFIDKEGSIILGFDYTGYSLEIYDDYRE